MPAPLSLGPRSEGSKQFPLPDPPGGFPPAASVLYLCPRLLRQGLGFLLPSQSQAADILNSGLKSRWLLELKFGHSGF